jgi:hypothetical protein
MSPAKIWIGVTIAAIHIAIENIVLTAGCLAVLQQVPRADSADNEGGGQIGRKHHVGEAVGEGRVEDDGHQFSGTNWPSR